MAGNLPYHPAPGLGDLLPGYFVVPQNPIKNRAPVTMNPGIGDILPGYYTVPQNPIKGVLTGDVQPIGTSKSGCGCGGGCGCGSKGGMINGQRVGMGDLTSIQSEISAGNIMGVLEDTIGGVPVLMWIGAAVLLPMLMNSGGRRR